MNKNCERETLRVHTRKFSECTRIPRSSANEISMARSVRYMVQTFWRRTYKRVSNRLTHTENCKQAARIPTTLVLLTRSRFIRQVERMTFVATFDRRNFCLSRDRFTRVSLRARICKCKHFHVSSVLHTANIYAAIFELI